MGDPKKAKKKYSGPLHPWQKLRIDKENELKKFYSLKNKKEIWKASSLLRKFTGNAKRIIRDRLKKPEQSKLEETQLMNKLYHLNLIEKDKKSEDVLSLTVENILDRRLQSQVQKLGLARSMIQARQFIVHGHISVSGKKLAVPTYLVKREDTITFSPNSTLADPEHPERASKEKEIKKELQEIRKETAELKNHKEEPGVENK
ncbi:MAG: 30S ribosomal protein S4 [Candidatus Nanoarchaeia archaeon]|nr:30S ribosomal protein S4 [Candidatus Nanoarchaeia archaeon]MDD5588179.1 30S ribosomal protein S4 [Candidatus Nanoarchaeia archaeon]